MRTKPMYDAEFTMDADGTRPAPGFGTLSVLMPPGRYTVKTHRGRQVVHAAARGAQGSERDGHGAGHRRRLPPLLEEGPGGHDDERRHAATRSKACARSSTRSRRRSAIRRWPTCARRATRSTQSSSSSSGTSIDPAHDRPRSGRGALPRRSSARSSTISRAGSRRRTSRPLPSSRKSARCWRNRCAIRTRRCRA